MLPAFNARNNSATKPSTTKRPTQKSRAAVFFIVFPKNLVAVFCVKDCAPHNVHEPVNGIATQSASRSRPEQLVEHQRGQQEIQPEHGQRAVHHRFRGRARNAFRRRLGFITLEQRDERDSKAKHQALDHAVTYVAPYVDAACIWDQNAPESTPIISTPTT